MFYSGFTEMQLAQPAMMLTEQLLSQGFSDTCKSIPSSQKSGADIFPSPREEVQHKETSVTPNQGFPSL